MKIYYNVFLNKLFDIEATWVVNNKMSMVASLLKLLTISWRMLAGTLPSSLKYETPGRCFFNKSFSIMSSMAGKKFVKKTWNCNWYCLLFTHLWADRKLEHDVGSHSFRHSSFLFHSLAVVVSVLEALPSVRYHLRRCCFSAYLK